MNIIDWDGYEVVKRPRRLAQFVPQTFAVDADGSGDSVAKESLKSKSLEPKPTMEKSTRVLTKKSLAGDSCSKRGRYPGLLHHPGHV